jgi:hypothetical protein
MNYTVSLIKRQKIEGLGTHYAVQLGNQVFDIQKNGMNIISSGQFSHFGKYKVEVELTRTISYQEFLRQYEILKNLKYDKYTANCEHWARQFVEGKFQSHQIDGLVIVGSLIALAYALAS